MRVLLLGHSYVNHLRHLGNWNTEVTLQNNSRVSLEFLFRSYPGKDYRYFLDHDETFNVVRSEQPMQLLSYWEETPSPPNMGMLKLN